MKTIFTSSSGDILAVEYDKDTFNSPGGHRLFVVDQQYNVLHLKQSTTDNEAYDQLEKWNVSQVDEFRSSLDWLSKTDFTRASISRRCITVRNKTCVFETSHVFDSLSPKIIDDLHARLTLEKRGDLVVVSSQRLEATDKEIFTLLNQKTQMLSLLVKAPPATRKCDLIGRKTHIDELVFVSANKILVKRRWWDGYKRA